MIRKIIQKNYLKKLSRRKIIPKMMKKIIPKMIRKFIPKMIKKYHKNDNYYPENDNKKISK